MFLDRPPRFEGRGDFLMPFGRYATTTASSSVRRPRPAASRKAATGHIPVPAKRKQVAQVPVAHSCQPPVRDPNLNTSNPGPNVNIRIAVPRVGKGSTVHVLVGAEEVEVTVTAASGARALPLQKPLRGR